MTTTETTDQRRERLLKELQEDEIDDMVESLPNEYSKGELSSHLIWELEGYTAWILKHYKIEKR